jgi:hypothetical protein
MTDAEKAKLAALAKYHTQLDALLDEAILDKDGVALFALMDACVDRVAWFAASLDSQRGEDRNALGVIIEDLTRVYQQVIDRRENKITISTEVAALLAQVAARKPK